MAGEADRGRTPANRGGQAAPRRGRRGLGPLLLVRAAAVLSLPPILVLACAAETRGLAVALGLALALPWLAVLLLLAFPTWRDLTARGLEVAVIAGVIGSAVFAVLVATSPVRERIPPIPSAVLWSFPFVQAGLVLAARRARRAFPGRPLPGGARLLVAAGFFVAPLTLSSPLLLGAHPQGEWWTNESRARSDVRQMIAAQVVYAAAPPGGFAPIGCLAGRDATGSGECVQAPPERSLLREEMASPVRAGYRFELHRTASREGGEGPGTFAYTAVPLRTGGYPGWRRSGGRAFCGDSTGRICAVSDGSPPALERGLCAASCVDVD